MEMIRGKRFKIVRHLVRPDLPGVLHPFSPGQMDDGVAAGPGVDAPIHDK